MGQMKAAMMEDEDNLAAAAAYLVGRGDLKECEWHGYIYGGEGWDLETPFWVSVMADRKRGDRGPIPWAADIEANEFKRIIGKAYRDYSGVECPGCDKLRRE